MIEFKNRQSTNPNRRRLIIKSQTPEEIIADIERADLVTGEGEGTPINAETFNNMQNEIKAYVDGKVYEFTESSWDDEVFPFKVKIDAATHGLGAKAWIAYFNDGSDEFEWIKDSDGNIIIFSNVKVKMKVNLK